MQLTSSWCTHFSAYVRNINNLKTGQKYTNVLKNSYLLTYSNFKNTCRYFSWSENNDLPCKISLYILINFFYYKSVKIQIHIQKDDKHNNYLCSRQNNQIARIKDINEFCYIKDIIYRSVNI